MAEIAPFRGILYTERAGDASRLLAPPYDVISPEERETLAALDPHNAVRLILPKDPSGGDSDEKYEQSARDLRAWLDEGALARDAAPAIYRYHQRFPDAAGKEVTRKGFIARVRLRRFDEGVILPHERTLSGPKLDRLKLMRATRTHFSQVFGLYPDRERKTDELFEAVERTPPAIDVVTPDGVAQRLWRLTDSAAIRALASLMAERKVYIADGHHRYETMIALRDELSGAARSPSSSVNYGAMFFCNMDDPGLVVFPTHRVLRALPGFNPHKLLEAAEPYFLVREVRTNDRPEDRDMVRTELAREGARGPSFAIAAQGWPNRVAILRLRPDLDLDGIAAMPRAPSLRVLDVTVLHAIVFETILGIDRAAQEKQTNLRYVKDWNQAIDEISTNTDVQAIFFMNPTRVDQVKAVADAGEVMPQKSTFFFPKIASALVINPIDPEEEIDAV